MGRNFSEGRREEGGEEFEEVKEFAYRYSVWSTKMEFENKMMAVVWHEGGIFGF